MHATTKKLGIFHQKQRQYMLLYNFLRPIHLYFRSALGIPVENPSDTIGHVRDIQINMPTLQKNQRTFHTTTRAIRQKPRIKSKTK